MNIEKLVLLINSILKIILLSITLSALSGCKKYLDAKQNKQLVTPSSVQDLQGLLDDATFMNKNCSEAGEIASDNYYLTDNNYLALPHDRDRAAYLWQQGLFVGMSPTDWQNEYDVVYNTNIVLENLSKIERNASNQSDWDNCKGEALVFRAKAFYEVAQIWSLAYDSSTANTDLGIPLRLTSDFNVKSVRSTMHETYSQILSDLKSAIPLLPNTPKFVYRPSKPASYGLLARTYLAMRDYKNAKLYADSSLQINSELLDYNTINPIPFLSFQNLTFNNPEDIMHSYCYPTNKPDNVSYALVDTTLYQSYNDNDLRKQVFFKSFQPGGYTFFGSYDGTNVFNYNGIANDEMYLIRAECLAREGNTAHAMSDLNTLLEKRFVTGTFVPLTASNATDALNKILTERRKELVFRTLRFTDIKRLNKEGANITQTRIIQGQTYTLPPNDPRYALPIPNNVIQLSGMQQNPGW